MLFDAIKEAIMLKNKYKTNNPFELMRELDIVCHKHYLAGSLRGYYTEAYGQPNIIINCNLSYEEQKKVAAHELAHVILHRRYNYLNTGEYFRNKHERQADEFAKELLRNDCIYNCDTFDMDYVSI